MKVDRLAVFREWAVQLQGYMEASQLLMSTLGWKLETDLKPFAIPYPLFFLYN